MYVKREGSEPSGSLLPAALCVIRPAPVSLFLVRLSFFAFSPASYLMRKELESLACGLTLSET